MPKTRSFHNLTGPLLEQAIIDEISQQNKTNPRIQLRYMDIKKITKNMFKHFANIYAIDLRGNEIEEIENGSFVECSKLEKIDLMENQLTKISKNTFDGDFPDLQELTLSYNAIAAIETGSFDKMYALESIDLSNNCLKHLHSNVFKKCPDLRQVYLHDNDIVKIESDLFNSKTDLKHLNLANNNLDFIPEFELKKVKIYDMSRNKIALLDLNYDSLEIKKSASVTELNVAFNLINQCQTLVERRTDILHLNVSNNRLENFDDFPALLNLEVLVLANNNLTHLSLFNFEEKFPSLKVLNVHENPLDCNDYNYVNENLHNLVVSADSALNNRCIRNSSHQEFQDYEVPIINEIRTKNKEVIEQLKLNRYLLITLLLLISSIAIILIVNDKLKLMNRTKPNLIEQIEL